MKHKLVFGGNRDNNFQLITSKNTFPRSFLCNDNEISMYLPTTKFACFQEKYLHSFFLRMAYLLLRTYLENKPVQIILSIMGPLPISGILLSGKTDLLSKGFSFTKTLVKYTIIL